MSTVNNVVIRYIGTRYGKERVAHFITQMFHEIISIDSAIPYNRNFIQKEKRAIIGEVVDITISISRKTGRPTTPHIPSRHSMMIYIFTYIYSSKLLARWCADARSILPLAQTLPVHHLVLTRAAPRDRSQERLLYAHHTPDIGLQSFRLCHPDAGKKVQGEGELSHILIDITWIDDQRKAKLTYIYAHIYIVYYI